MAEHQVGLRDEMSCLIDLHRLRDRGHVDEQHLTWLTTRVPMSVRYEVSSDVTKVEERSGQQYWRSLSVTP